MSLRLVVRALPVLVSVVISVGCIEREGIPVSPCTNVNLVAEIDITTVDAVDLLFMVDNSGSMSQEQVSLTDQFPRMINILASGDFDQDGDFFGDGEIDDPDFEPVRSLHVGVITSDMGTGGFSVTTCVRSDFGDDGILRIEGHTGTAGCMAAYPSFLAFEPESGASVAGFASDVACVARVGTGGCGFEQQLEATLKALSPSAPTEWTAAGYAAPTFFQNTFGHGDTNNEGFIRSDSVLAIILVTDEEDCSVRDPELFNPSGAFGATSPNLRCFAHPETLHGIARYVDGLLQLRPNPGRLIYVPIVGIPVDLAPAPGESPDWGRLVSSDPAVCDIRMHERIDPSNPERLIPSCDVSGRGLAFPPIRITRVAQQLQAAGAGVTVQSICQESFETALTEIITLVKRALNNVCLPRAINREADGSVDCDIVAVPPMGMSCADVPGSSPRLIDGAPVLDDGRPVCTMPQVVPDDRALGAAPPVASGWFYDDFTNEGEDNCAETGGAGWQRIGFTVQPPSGSLVRLECFQSVVPGSDGIGIGTFCDPAADTVCGAGRSPGGATLSCDPVARMCGVPCSSSADCRGAGLIGYTCDQRPLSEVGGAPFAGASEPYAYCVNPTC